MKLVAVQITAFQSITDSTEFTIGNVTCLVGKNEAGKTALLKALYRLNPIVDAEGNFDVTDDYPRRSVTDYQTAVEAAQRPPADVVRATYALEPPDIDEVKQIYGSRCLTDASPIVTLCKGYANTRTFSDLNVNQQEAIKHLIKAAGLSQTLASQISRMNLEGMIEALNNAEQTEAVGQLTSKLQDIAKDGLPYVVYNSILRERVPKFLYFDEYYLMKGQDNLDALMARVERNELEEPDHPLLGLIALAGLNLQQILAPERTEGLLAKLEAAENQLTQKVLKYWSQNRHLRLKFDIRPARPQDPPSMTDGTNIWGRVHDTKHMVSTALGTRSRGFIWFFSFLAWYSQLRAKNENIILLLDEPGLSLHAKAQEDLLRYFEVELKPHHQLIYTTHSPFMVDPTHFDRVRIVQDRSLETDTEDLPESEEGTKVITEVLDATPDSLFPLQGALGYEIYQTLFVGPNCLVVEGVSDLLYIQTISTVLQEKGRTDLSSKWTITPVGGADKVPTFVALIGAQTRLNVAVLLDFQKKDKQTLENLYKRKLLKKRKVLTYADYVGKGEADIEDMFEPDFYLELVNGAFGSSFAVADLPKNPPRILRRIENHVKGNPLPRNAKFNHYAPARYFASNIGSFVDRLSEEELNRFEQAFNALNGLL